MFHTIGIIVKPEAEAVSERLAAVVAYLKKRTCEVLLDNTAKSCRQLIESNGLEVLDRRSLGERCDLVITLGGDGTILGAARSMANYGRPVLGINMGRLGFLADVSPDDFEQVLDEVFQGNYISDERFLFFAEVFRQDESVFRGEAMNDVVLHVRNVARMIEFETRIDGQFVNYQAADGLIVATPTGSTAYAVSSGGPILHANLNAITLVPICPHTLSSRPLVISADSTVEVIVHNTRQAVAQVTCDGQLSFDMEDGDALHIRKKVRTATLLHPKNHSFYEILRAKLRWSERLEK